MEPTWSRGLMSGGNPPPSSEEVSARMKATPRRDTSVEMAIRREIHSRGLRYRVDESLRPVTRGRPDIVFPTEKVAVFIDGCFWHGCPEHGSIPDSNSEWWEEKLQANVERDERHTEELEGAGWTVLRIWEHREVTEAADEIERVVRQERGQ